jgi:integrase/recombinase XerD
MSAVALTPVPVALPPLTGLDPLPLPADRHPVAVYLASHAPNSRRALRHALELAARLLTGGRFTADVLPWHALRYQHMQALRTALLDAKRLDGAPHAPATANLALTAVRGVLREAAQLGLMTFEEEARTCRVKPIPGRRLPAGRMLTADELTRLFVICGTDPRPAGARDAALLAVLALCGPRRSELVHLDLADYDATAGTLRVRTGKGNKERVLVGNPQMVQALAEWLEVRGPMPGSLFLPLTKGGQLCWRRLTDKSVSWILQVRAAQAVVPDFSPHDLRRTCISNLLDSGADLVTVSELAGHASVTTTATYDRRGEAAKRAAMLKMTIPHVSRRALPHDQKAGAA